MASYPRDQSEREELRRTIEAVEESTRRINALTLNVAVREQLAELNRDARRKLDR